MMWFSGLRRTLVLSLCVSIGWCAVRAAEPPPPPATVPAAAAASAAEELLKAKSLTRVGSTYLLETDAKLPERMRALRAAQRAIDENARRRAVLTLGLRQAQAAQTRADRELADLSRRMANAKKEDTFAYNKLVA